MSSAFILCIVGLVTITAGLFLVPLVTDRVCDQQRARGQKTPDILSYPQVGEECTKVLTTGFLALLSVPAILLLLVGLFILIMAGTNRIFASLGHRIGEDGDRAPRDTA